MRYCLLIDFGSTYTKLTAVDCQEENIIGTATSYTTVETNILLGYQEALNKLTSQQNMPTTFDQHLICSSAKGGFKMVAVGLSPTLTTEAAKRAALGAGTRVLDVFSYGLSERDVATITEHQPDVILLSGGTDGGNEKTIVEDAKLLATLTIDVPIVVAGNQDTYPLIQKIFEQSKTTYFLTKNVMPKVNVLHAEPTRKILRDIFMSNIITAKGMDVIQKELSPLVLPTPTAVLQAAELLSKGTPLENGLGDLLVVDIGGATTDIHSIGAGKPVDMAIQLIGLQESDAKRTVEGDLGMRYSAVSLLETIGLDTFQKEIPSLTNEEVIQACDYRSKQPMFVSETKKDILIDETIAKLAIQTAIDRHAGFYQREKTPTRTIYYQTGKDLTRFKAVIGTGGILAHSKNPLTILNKLIKRPDDKFLLPEHPTMYLDSHYILSAMGLLAEVNPDLALKLLKKYLIPLK